MSDVIDRNYVINWFKGSPSDIVVICLLSMFNPDKGLLTTAIPFSNIEMVEEYVNSVASHFSAEGLTIEQHELTRKQEKDDIILRLSFTDDVTLGLLQFRFGVGIVG